MINLANEFATLISDYRLYEIPRISSKNILDWLGQFPASYQEIILKELLHIYKKFYYSRNRIIETFKFLIDLIRCEFRDFVEFPAQIASLNLQGDDKSQSKILKLIMPNIDFPMTEIPHKSTKLIIYIDDCIHSGINSIKELNSFFSDKPDLVGKINSGRIKFVVCTLALHSQAKSYLASKLVIKPTMYVNGLLINNYRVEGPCVMTLWPKFSKSMDQCVKDYYGKLTHKDEVFRDFSYTAENEKLFLDYRNRDIIETLFIKAGLARINSAQNPKPIIRPLGFEALQSFGFGTFFTTAFNVPNTSPLVLWYGNPSQLGSPLANFTPLFPRRISENYKPDSSYAIKSDLEEVSIDDLPF